MALPPQTRLFMCHDYKAPGRDDYAWETTVPTSASSTSTSGTASAKTTLSPLRTARDATLVGAAAVAAFDPGQHARRQVSARSRQRPSLPHHSGEIQERPCCAVVRARPACVRRTAEIGGQDARWHKHKALKLNQAKQLKAKAAEAARLRITRQRAPSRHPVRAGRRRAVGGRAGRRPSVLPNRRCLNISPNCAPGASSPPGATRRPSTTGWPIHGRQTNH